MKLLTEIQYQKLIVNGSEVNRGKDHFPVVKLFMPGTGCTWLLTELEPEEPNIAFGLCDLGMGFPECGYVDLEEISKVKSPIGLSVERDLHFEAKFPLSVYSKAAHDYQQITESHFILSRYAGNKPANIPKP